MRRPPWRTAAVLAALLLCPAAADPATEALLAERQCLACHGPRGVSPLPLTPSLAGQQPDFLTLQMILFREGLRQVPAMTEAARGLADAQIEGIAAWFAAQPSAPNPDRGARDPALAARGAELSARHHCASCHGADYAGRGNVPRVNHQREDFLARTLADYRDGQRVGADTQMNGLLHGFSDADLRALAHHLAHRP